MIHKLKNIPVRDLLHHHPKDTLPPGTLQNFLQATRWTEDDLKRLCLIV